MPENRALKQLLSFGFFFWAGCLATGAMAVLRMFFALRQTVKVTPWLQFYRRSPLSRGTFLDLQVPVGMPQYGETYRRGLVGAEWTGPLIQAGVLLGLCVLFWALATERLPLIGWLTKDVQKRRVARNKVIVAVVVILVLFALPIEGIRRERVKGALRQIRAKDWTGMGLLQIMIHPPFFAGGTVMPKDGTFTVVVEDEWHDQSYQWRLEWAQAQWRHWAKLLENSEGGVIIVDRKGNVVGGSHTPQGFIESLYNWHPDPKVWVKE